MTLTKSESILVVRHSFVGRLDADTEFIGLEGRTKVRSDHPAVKKWPEFFEPLKIDVIEQATAAPGEKRGH